MSNNNSFLTFLAGAAFGAAAYAFVKSDKEKVKEALDKLENMLVEGGEPKNADVSAETESVVEPENELTAEEETI